MYKIDHLDNGRYALIVLPETMNPAYGRIHIDRMPGAISSDFSFEAWEIGQMMGGN